LKLTRVGALIVPVMTSTQARRGMRWMAAHYLGEALHRVLILLATIIRSAIRPRSPLWA
jgi:hypothetical protein